MRYILTKQDLKKLLNGETVNADIEDSEAYWESGELSLDKMNEKNN